ncbi:hydrogenase nickel incorporation protein HypB [Mariprofundus ferrinatatus]|uniref:Hydrogenase maturation factor HypB n=1 Tax=Mariprofundus ferrinatatus TaxID=1921087 RepID=A0A2K8L3A1_9PROT|nr:hydrogenase nickel incorporation protein HypB [Mariprofundus ferrinatatus]ATX81733.1 hydrogenase nickel incorporation protein HypB [Mariprofundus ferrinatatus]
MCTVCGCGEPNEHKHEHSHGHHYGHGEAGAHVAGMEQSRLVSIEQDILSKNNRYADANRRYFNHNGVLCLNLVSSPGAGKTTLLSKTIAAIKNEVPVSVIEGDQQTDLDAARIREAGSKAVQINTGKGCHLDAHMIGHAIDDLKPASGSALFIENVGNLVCPAAFDLGEAAKVVILSVTEGSDKPLKYPDMFHAANLMIINKTDLLPYVDFDLDACCDFARRINPGIKILKLSATTGEGMDGWLNWIKANCEIARTGGYSQEQSS